MAKTNLSDLNSALFKALDDLDGTDPMSGKEMTPEQVSTTIKRANAVAAVSAQIIQVADLRIKATKMVIENRGAQSMLKGIVNNDASE